MSPFARFWRTVLFLPIREAEARRCEIKKVKEQLAQAEARRDAGWTWMNRAGDNVGRLLNEVLGEIRDEE